MSAAQQGVAVAVSSFILAVCCLKLFVVVMVVVVVAARSRCRCVAVQVVSTFAASRCFERCSTEAHLVTLEGFENCC